MNIILKARANKTIKYIKYLQKKNIEWLQDEEGNAYFVGTKNLQEMRDAWLNDQ